MSVAVTVKVKVPTPRVAPEMTPLLLSLIPGGRLPAVSVKVTVPVPPVAVTGDEYNIPIFDAGKLAVVMTTGGLIVMLKVLVIVAPAASVMVMLPEANA